MHIATCSHGSQARVTQYGFYHLISDNSCKYEVVANGNLQKTCKTLYTAKNCIILVRPMCNLTPSSKHCKEMNQHKI